jgi:type IV pilus assembly protein PilV
MRRKSYSPASAQQGVMLIEAMVAILLFSVGVLAIAGLQATMIENTNSSRFRTEASYIAQQKIGAMWADVGGTMASLNNVAPNTPDADIPNLLPGGKITVVATAANQYVVTVGWTAPGETAALGWITPPCSMPVAHCFVSFATIKPISTAP